MSADGIWLEKPRALSSVPGPGQPPTHAMASRLSLLSSMTFEPPVPADSLTISSSQSSLTPKTPPFLVPPLLRDILCPLPVEAPLLLSTLVLQSTD